MGIAGAAFKQNSIPALSAVSIIVSEISLLIFICATTRSDEVLPPSCSAVMKSFFFHVAVVLSEKRHWFPRVKFSTITKQMIDHVLCTVMIPDTTTPFTSAGGVC